MRRWNKRGVGERADPGLSAPNGPHQDHKDRGLIAQGSQEDFKAFLQKNSYVFAWSHDDMPSIDPAIILHRLNVDLQCKPVKQKRKLFNVECYEAIKAKVDKLLKVDFIRGVDYLTWLSNIVLVKKANR